MDRYIYRDPARRNDPHALPDVEIIYMTKNKLVQMGMEHGLYLGSSDEGWYWASGFPGCLWDSDPVGPFPTEQEAIDDVREYG